MSIDNTRQIWWVCEQGVHVKSDIELANSSTATVDDLCRLARSQDPGVRGSVAINRRTPIWLLGSLVRDEDRYVRIVLSMNINASAEVLTHLANDTDVVVKDSVAKHLNTPPLVKLWLQSGYRESMTLKEFLEAAQ
jgi:hypothetical protein